MPLLSWNTFTDIDVMMQEEILDTPKAVALPIMQQELA
jgi:hypothetical protein